MLGGFSQMKALEDEHHQILNSVKDQVEQHQNQQYQTFTGISVSQQVVAGMNYDFIVHIGDNKKIKVRVYKPLPYTNLPPKVSSVDQFQE